MCGYEIGVGTVGGIAVFAADVADDGGGPGGGGPDGKEGPDPTADKGLSYCVTFITGFQ
jgi:hypothetical protein